MWAAAMHQANSILAVTEQDQLLTQYSNHLGALTQVFGHMHDARNGVDIPQPVSRPNGRQFVVSSLAVRLVAA